MMENILQEIRQEKLVESSDWVYVFKSKELYKIGYAWDWEGRLDTIRGANPFGVEMVLVAQMPNYKEIEEKLHKMFATKRIYREWFRLAKKDLMEILKIFKQEQANAQNNTTVNKAENGF